MENNLDMNDYNQVSQLSVSYCENAPMGKWRSAYHNVLEIYYLVDGECQMFIDSKTYTLRPGDMVLIPPWTFHRAIYYEGTLVTRYVVSCNTANILPKANEILLSSGHYIERIPRSLGDVEKIFFKICKEYCNPHLLSEELICGYITELATLIYLAEKSRKSIIDAESSNGIVELAVTYLQSNYSSDISVDDVCRYVSVSKAHLSRIFKEETGLGIKEYLAIYRVKQAEFMLSESSSKSISEIAYSCGFSDSNYFASLFKKTVGITPTEFRKRCLVKQDDLH